MLYQFANECSLQEKGKKKKSDGASLTLELVQLWKWFVRGLESNKYHDEIQREKIIDCRRIELKRYAKGRNRILTCSYRLLRVILTRGGRRIKISNQTQVLRWLLSKCGVTENIWTAVAKYFWNIFLWILNMIMGGGGAQSIEQSVV